MVSRIAAAAAAAAAAVAAAATTAAAATVSAGPTAPATVQLDLSVPGRRYQGLGGVSGGGYVSASRVRYEPSEFLPRKGGVLEVQFLGTRSVPTSSLRGSAVS